MRDRPALSLEDWCELLVQPLGIRPEIADFAYRYLPRYCGLEFARVLPDDRLEEDLLWVEVCWFDWQLNLCDDFWDVFQIDISDRLLEYEPSTIISLLRFLNDQLQDKAPPQLNSR